MKNFLKSTELIESSHPEVINLTEDIIRNLTSTKEKARKLFYFVREKISYDPYSVSFNKMHYKTTFILKQSKGYCVQKAVVLVSLARAAGIPARLCFADIRNHLASENLVSLLGCNLFVFHGYVEMFIEGKWVKVTPSFEKKLCEENGFPVVEFDGENNAVFPATTAEGRPFVEYVRYHGTFNDVPLSRIVSAWKEYYGSERVESWKNFLKF